MGRTRSNEDANVRAEKAAENAPRQPKEATPGRVGVSKKTWKDWKWDQKKGWGMGADGNFYKWEDLSDAERKQNNDYHNSRTTRQNKKSIDELDKDVEKLKLHDEKWRKIVTYGGGAAALAGLAGLVNSMRKEDKK